MPQRRKKAKRRRVAKKKRASRKTAGPADAATLDLAVLRALILLSTADCLELADHRWPPSSICRWLEKADRRDVRGLLLATLERWRMLHRHIGDV